jgi:uncharacterized protein (UPF0335 family)
LTITIAPDRLIGFVTEIERAERSAAQIATDKTELFKAAKDAGVNVGVLRKVIAARRKPLEERQTEESLYANYWRILTSGGHGQREEAAE